MKLTVKCISCGEPTDINVLHVSSMENVLFNTSVVCKKCSGLDNDKKADAKEKGKKYKDKQNKTNNKGGT